MFPRGPIKGGKGRRAVGRYDIIPRAVTDACLVGCGMARPPALKDLVPAKRRSASFPLKRPLGRISQQIKPPVVFT